MYPSPDSSMKRGNNSFKNGSIKLPIQYANFSYIMAVSFIGGGNLNNRNYEILLKVALDTINPNLL
jgi:hypothetical protein